MKKPLTIGQFSKKVGLSSRTLRVYEDVGLLQAQARGENGYRYYNEAQLELVERIKKFKSLGFSLEEIRSLLEVDTSMNSHKLESLLQQRQRALEEQAANLHVQKRKIENILTSLKKNQQGLSPQARRFIMTHFEKISVVVAGIRDLEKTAEYIRNHIKKAGKDIPIQVWDGVASLPIQKPYILVVSEGQLTTKDVSGLTPDVVVIKELSESAQNITKAYLQLYNSVGPHMATILNADDRAVVELAGNPTIRKGKTYYFSKNSGLKSQISKIGGVLSDGEEIEMYGFNRTKDSLKMKFGKILGLDEEVAFLTSIAAVMDIGLKESVFEDLGIK
jgi:DNA-binding transcriptional MerR regulator